MPIYQYKCPICDLIFEKFYTFSSYSSTRPKCPNCGRPMSRVYSFAFNRPFKEHWNMSLGKFVTSEKQINDELRRLEEKSFNRIGYAPKYEMVPLKEYAPEGVEDGRPPSS